MFLARELLIAGAVLSVIGAGAGCATKAVQPDVMKLSPAPIVQDEAMTLRDWGPVASRYANGSCVAYPTLYPYVPRRDLPDEQTLITGPALFVGQTALLPVTAIATPPWQDTVYRGVYVPPTYTAVPVPADDAAGYAPVKWPLLIEPRR